jgi:hypothetical protein
MRTRTTGGCCAPYPPGITRRQAMRDALSLRGAFRRAIRLMPARRQRRERTPPEMAGSQQAVACGVAPAKPAALAN